MPTSPQVTDRFDDLPADRSRVGAHRAHNPRMSGGTLLLWSVIATVALVAAGVFGTLVATDRITLFPAASTPAAPPPTVEPVVDTSFAVTVLNATPQRGLAAQVRDQIVAAGWSPDVVTDSSAGSTDFETTTVYYAFPENEGAARGLADVIGASKVELNDSYQPEDDPATTDVDEGELKQLVVVVGLDRTTPAG